MNKNNKDNIFKIKIKYEGIIINKAEVKGIKGLKKIFKGIEEKIS